MVQLVFGVRLPVHKKIKGDKTMMNTKNADEKINDMIFEELKNFQYDTNAETIQINELASTIAKRVTINYHYVKFTNIIEDVENLLKQSVIYNDCIELNEFDNMDLDNICDDIDTIVNW
tara:strand:- start:792 stop:1148 length:357 start_codon:yes stop_codon:yes gene_type:complete